MEQKKILVLGCTGSIGTSTLNIIREFPTRFRVAGLTAHSSAEKLNILSREFGGVPALLTENADEKELKDFIFHCGADIAVNGIAGSSGLRPSVFVLEAGMDLALANKETIVMAGNFVQKLAEKTGSKILPVDSEHSAVFSLIQRYGTGSVQEIVLTASGGPFRNFTREQLRSVTPADALRHPTWNMGQKITVDSASLANKGLEVIEACRLFNIPPEQVKVTIHPQSLVHSLIRTKDGVLYGQISPPDMRHPILTALTWPEFVPNSLEQLDLAAGAELSFFPPRTDVFPMLPLAYEAVQSGSTGTIAYNAANEIAAAAFLAGKLPFTDIPRITGAVLKTAPKKEPVTLDDIFLLDTQARHTAQQLCNTGLEVFH